MVDQHVAKEISPGIAYTFVSVSTSYILISRHKLQKEKIDLENTLEQEQEYMVNRLQKQLDLFRQQQQQQQQQTSPIPSRHESSTCSPSSIPASPVVSATTAATAIPSSRQMADSMLPAPPGLVEVLRYELINLRARALEMEKECKYLHFRMLTCD